MHFLHRIGGGAAMLASLALAAPVRAAVDYPAVAPRPLVFPRDHGSHPEYRTEWWYLTGWLDVPGATSLANRWSASRRC